MIAESLFLNLKRFKRIFKASVSIMTHVQNARVQVELMHMEGHKFNPEYILLIIQFSGEILNRPCQNIFRYLLEFINVRVKTGYK